MKLRFLCANHREWLQSQPHQALHWCANSFETGWNLFLGGHFKDALAHMGCAFETAEILLTTRAIAPGNAARWFLKTLDGLLQTLEHLQLTQTCIELYQIAIDRLRKEVSYSISPELEASLYQEITRLNRARRHIGEGGIRPVTSAFVSKAQRGTMVLH
ncbi:Uncharacterised protein [Halioglobus japonicus]|nr:Uncharacterised protein [Halioglobus japonicus]